MKFLVLWIMFVQPNPSTEHPSPARIQVGTAPSEAACKEIMDGLLPKLTNYAFGGLTPENWVSPTYACVKGE